jgi:transposase
MKKVIKQVLGIDVAQKELVVCLGRMLEDLVIELYARKTFANTAKGFEALEQWVSKLSENTLPVSYVMEATGVYHEPVAYFLKGCARKVSIVMPNKISNYMRTLDIKTVTDKTCADAIARFGLERTLDSWEKPSAAYKKIRQLTRERDQLVQERTLVKNQLHAEQAEAAPNKNAVKRITQRIAFLDKQEKEILAEITMLVKKDEEIKGLVTLICSIPGVGELTAATVLAETNGFDLVSNKKQLTSYAGLDVKEKESGTSVKGKPRISKKGNRFLRKALHMPALAAIRNDENFKAVFTRLVAKHGIKMKAVVAVQRKLLELMYTLYRTGQKYDVNHFKEKEEKGKNAA